jgi:hypothetical protein
MAGGRAPPPLPRPPLAPRLARRRRARERRRRRGDGAPGRDRARLASAAGRRPTARARAAGADARARAGGPPTTPRGSRRCRIASSCSTRSTRRRPTGTTPSRRRGRSSARRTARRSPTRASTSSRATATSATRSSRRCAATTAGHVALRTARSWRLRARASRREATMKDASTRTAAAERFLPLCASGRLEGRVVAPDGSPCPSISVYVQWLAGARVPEEFGSSFHPSELLTTGADGRFALDPLPAGRPVPRRRDGKPAEVQRADGHPVRRGSARARRRGVRRPRPRRPRPRACAFRRRHAGDPALSSSCRCRRG